MGILLQYLMLFKPDVRIFVGFWMVVILPGLFLLMIVTGIRVWAFCARMRRGETEAYARTHFASGRPRPPIGEGVCDRCQKACGEVYYLPSGEKVCPRCYGAPEAPA